MPSERVAQHISKSLAEGERQEDFECMLDTLTQMRRPYFETPDKEVVEAGAGKILCLLIWPKPREYVDAMQRFRILFHGIADSPQLQATFANSVLLAALTVGEQVHYLPSLYFSWEPILRASANRSRSARRSALPAVAVPGFSDESPRDDDHVGEGHPEVDHLLPPFGTPRQLLVGVECQELVLCTTHRFVAVSGAGLPFWAISASSPRSSRRSRVAFES
jgi:hypothetical protein